MKTEEQAPAILEPVKKCSRCEQVKSVGDFYWKNKDRNMRYGYCKPCAYTKRPRRKKENPEPPAQRYRRSWLKRRYNMTPAQYDDLLAAQGGGCAICKTKVSGGIGRFHIDHDHACCPEKMRSCGKCIRGLLCSYCNMHLAVSDPERLRAALKYVENFRRSQGAKAGRAPVSWGSEKQGPVAGSPRAPWTHVPERLF